MVAPLSRWLCFGLLLTLVGCAGYREKSAAFVSPYAAGAYPRATAEVAKQAEDAPKRDALLLRLEQGAILRAAGDYAASQAAFTQAEQWLDYWEDQPGFKISSGAASVVTNLSALPYRGRSYDRIMLNTYQALNAMATGNTSDARVYLRRAYERQRQAVAQRAGELEDQTAAIREQQVNLERTLDSANYQRATNQATAALGALRPYAPYVNPFTEYLQGVFYLAAGVDAGETERSLQSFERAAALAPGNPYIPADVEVAQAVANGAPVPPLTYVVVEAGLAPYRSEMRIDLPLFIFGGPVDYVGVALPRLQPVPGAAGSLRVQADGQAYEPALVADFDSIVGQQLKDEMPSIVARTLLAAASKAALAYGARQSVQGNDTAEIAVRVVAGLFQYAANQADLRTWLTLPKQISIARFPTPPAGVVQVTGPGVGKPITVALDPQRLNVVYIKRVRPGGPLTVSQFALP